MPGIQINQLPIVTQLAGTSSVPIQPSGGTTSQISGQNLANALAALLGAFQASNYLTPAALGAGTTHDWDPIGWQSSVAILRMSSSNVAVSLDGLLAPIGSAPQLVFLLNCNTAAADITLVDGSSSGSLAANQFLIDRQSNLAVGFQGGVWCWYDPVSLKWRVII